MTKVIGEQLAVSIQRIGVDALQQLAHALVELLAVLDQQAVVGDFVHQGIREGVLRVDCHPAGQDQPAAFKLRQPQVDLGCARAEEIRLAFEALHATAQDQVITATLSIGVASYPADGATGDEVLGHADQALYQAKAAGRNRVIVFQ